MRPLDAGRWLLVATLWSLQYLFLRIAVPVFGAGPTADSRALFAAVFLVPWMVFVLRERIGMLRWWKDHLAIGVTNNVLPFVLLAWAATVLPAGYLAIINATVPLWAAVLSALILREALGARRIAGFVLGIAGIALIVNLGPVALDWRAVLAIVASNAAAALWGWAAVLIKQGQTRAPAMALATGSITWAAIVLLPGWLYVPPVEQWTPGATAALVAGGLVCSGFAYLAFFTLIRDIGPSRTMTVGFGIPVLGVFWGWLFLDEAVTLPMLAGVALVVVAVGLVLRR